VVNLINSAAAQYLHAASILRKNSSAEDEKATKTIDGLLSRARKLRNRNRISNVLTLAQSQTDLALSGDEWEQGTEMLLACQNGVIELTTGELKESNPKDYIRTVSPVEWTGIDTPAPLFEKFLSDIFNNDTELIEFVQRLFGYSLTGKANEAILPILYGEGRNGKSTLLETLKHVLGSLASPASQDVIIESYRNQSGNASPHLYALRHLRLAWVSETKEGQKLNEGQVKHLTGMDTITCRPLFREEVTFKTTHLLCLVTNNKPKANADDFALWNRILLLPFNQAFVKNPSDDNEHEADVNLFEKLKSESNGILAWLVRGCIEYQKTGLNPPESVTKATEDYKAEEDEISLFIEECCITEGVESEKTKVKYLYAEYINWTESEGIKPIGNRSFGKRLSKRFESSRSTGTQYHGIVLKLKPAEQQKMIQFTKKKDVF
jgi:putative DNA primase/helicase